MKRTDFLFARPSFIRGISKILDIGSTSKVYNTSTDVSEADLRALSSDWNMVGDDIREATADYQKQYKKELKSASSKRKQ